MAIRIEQYDGELPSNRGRGMTADSQALVDAMRESLSDGANKIWYDGGSNEVTYTKNVQKLAALAARHGWRVSRARVGKDLAFRAFEKESPQPEATPEPQPTPSPAKVAGRKAR